MRERKNECPTEKAAENELKESGAYFRQGDDSRW